MIEITDKRLCSGCGACAGVCPVSCISMQMDEEGFLYPVVDKAVCTQCGRCDKICHWKQDIYKRNDGFDSGVYCAYVKDDEVVNASASGGAFWPLAKWAIAQGGVVYGVELQENLVVAHARAESLEACRPFQKSKYLQTDTQAIYPMVKKDLIAGRTVVFSGTPCQIGGLYGFLGEDPPHLYTCEVICHGVPSRMVFDKYIKEVEQQFNKSVIKIIWRDKRWGWYPNHVTLFFDDGTEKSYLYRENPYHRGFVQNLYTRPSCYQCKYARLPRAADITLADYWSYTRPLAEQNDNKGLSAIVFSSEKGRQLFEYVQKDLYFEESTMDYLTKRSRHIHLPPKPNPNRRAFFRANKRKPFLQIMPGFIRRSRITGILIEAKCRIFKN